MNRLGNLAGHLGMRRFSVSVPPLSATPAHASAEPTVLVERDTVDPGVAILRLNRPKLLNAQSVTMAAEFKAAVESLSLDPTLRCVLLTGAGKAFSAGGDLDWLMLRTTEPRPSNNSEVMRRFYASFLSVRNLPVPVVSYINGPAVGAGFCLAIATDMRIAAASAKMSVNFAKLGLPPGMASTYLLPSIVGPQVAARLLLTGDLIGAEEAKALGLVMEVHPDSTGLEHSLQLCRRIAANAPAAVRMSTRSLRLTQESSGLDRALWREADCQALGYADSELKIGISAVREKKTPVFPTLSAAL